MRKITHIVCLVCVIFICRIAYSGGLEHSYSVSASLGSMAGDDANRFGYDVTPDNTGGSSHIVVIGGNRVAVDLQSSNSEVLLGILFGYSSLSSGFGINAEYQFGGIDIYDINRKDFNKLLSNVSYFLVNIDFHGLISGSSNIGAYFSFGIGAAIYHATEGSFAFHAARINNASSTVDYYAGLGHFFNLYGVSMAAKAKLGLEYLHDDDWVFGVDVGMIITTKSSKMAGGSRGVATLDENLLEVDGIISNDFVVVIPELSMQFLEVKISYFFDL